MPNQIKAIVKAHNRNIARRKEIKLRKHLNADALLSTKGYNSLKSHGYTHNKIVLSDSGDPAHVALPGVHRIASLLKRWLIGTHQGAVSKKHLDYYLDEYTFRFNLRTSKARGLLFYRLLQNAVLIGPAPYHQLTAGEQERGRRPEKI